MAYDCPTFLTRIIYVSFINSCCDSFFDSEFYSLYFLALSSIVLTHCNTISVSSNSCGCNNAFRTMDIRGCSSLHPQCYRGATSCDFLPADYVRLDSVACYRRSVHLQLVCLSGSGGRKV